MKRLWLTCSALIFVALLLMVVMSGYNSEPRYKGKSSTVWALDLSSANQKDREEAALALQKIGSNGVPSLSRMLVTTNHTQRDRALLLIAPHVPRPWRSRIYEKHFPVDPFRARILASKALGTIGPEARATIPVLNEMLADQQLQGTLADAAAATLAEIGKDSLPTLISDLQSKDKFLVQKAIYSISLMGADSKDAIPALVKQLSSADATICESAKRAISHIGPSAIPSLMEILQNGNPEERVLTAKALSLITPSSAATIHSLIKALDDKDPVVRQQLIETLGNLRAGSKPVILAFSRSLQDTNEEVRLEAVKMLGRAPAQAESAIPELSRLLNDPNDAVRSAADAVLKQITDHSSSSQTR